MISQFSHHVLYNLQSQRDKFPRLNRTSLQTLFTLLSALIAESRPNHANFHCHRGASTALQATLPAARTETSKHKPFLDVKCGLGESPFWEIKANVLRFVDIVGKAVYRVDLNAGPSSLQKQQYDISIG